MANSSNIRPFIQQWEGGLSRDTADDASARPAPWPYKGLTGWHTNKGVTYATFAGSAPKLGYQVTADNFFSMPGAIWDKIFKVQYWDPWSLDKMNSQAIADFIANAAWGSGLGGSFNSIAGYLKSKGITVNTRLEAVQALNKLALLNETQIFTELIDWRNAFYRSLSDFPKFGNGWLNRSAALKKFGIETIAKKKIRIIAIAVVLIVMVAAIGTFYYKSK